jgi:hypothetical protein
VKRLLAILILTTAALGVAACNNGTGSATSGTGSSAEPTISTSSEPNMSEAPASEMPSDSTTP